MSVEPLISVALGIALASATGLRVFLPLLVAAVAARWGAIPLADGFGWLSSTTSLIMLGSASVIEVAAYYVPLIDHALDVVASPAAMIAGTVASASVMAEIPPWVLWPVAIVAGGGAAGLTKATAAAVRVKSGLITVGLANPIVATIETLGATGIAVLAVVLPLLALAGVALLLYVSYRMARNVARLVFNEGRRPGPPPEPDSA
jgi:hypothetical protein